jgi:serine protease Do
MAVSLFDDSFYRGQKPKRPFRGGAVAGFLLLAAGIGVFLTFLVFPYLVNRGYVQVDMSQHRSDKISAVAEQMQPAIVSIFGYTEETDMELEDMQDYSIGSGVVVRKTGDVAQIVTNYHVIQGAKDIEVMLISGERLKAKLLAEDPMSDLALVEVKSKLLKHVAKYGDSDRLRVGETAIAIGNPLGLGNTPTITTGVISSLKRTVPVSLQNDEMYDWELDVIQTDAAVNEGNSGGALLNMRGELVGIISMKMLDVGVEGLAFAIPINFARPLIEQMMVNKKVERPYIGIVMQDLQEFVSTESLDLPEGVNQGVVVLEVDGPAKEIGLRAKDVIVRLDQQEIHDSIDLRKYLYAEKEIGDRLVITFYRDGKKQSTSLRLQKRDDE